MKKTLLKTIAVLSLIPMFAFSGCIEKNDTTSSKEDSNKEKDLSLSKVMDAWEFVLGLDASFPPMGFKDSNDKIVGFDIDVAQEVCDRMNITLKTQPIDWDTKEAELNAGNIDCIWNGLSVNEERAKAMNLSQPYMNNSMVHVV